METFQLINKKKIHLTENNFVLYIEILITTPPTCLVLNVFNYGLFLWGESDENVLE